MRKTLTSAAIALALASGATQAAPFVLPGGKPIYFQFNNLEQLGLNTSTGELNTIVVPTKAGDVDGSIDVNGDGIDDTPLKEGNWGVFNVSNMEIGEISNPNLDITGGNGTIFNNDGVGSVQGQISGIFYGIELTGLTTAKGGWIDIYWEDAATDDLTGASLNGSQVPVRTAANQAGDFTDGVLLARLQFKPGVVTGDSQTTLTSSVSLNNITGVGIADFFADVVDVNNDGKIDGNDGAWASAMNGDWFFVDPNGNGVRGEAGERRDLRFSTLFRRLDESSPWNAPGIIGLASNDPGRVFTVAEPGMVSLLGMGLLGAGLNLRRRRRA